LKQLENRISSREVAEMIEMEHPDLLKKIDKINEDFEKEKIPFQKYWVKGTYKAEGNNKSYREFQVSKLGCEFLAHKTTGTKGNLFTDKYMDRFEKMKKVIEGDTAKLPSMKAKEVESKYNNSLARRANAILRIANNSNLSKEYVQVLQAKASEILTGQKIIPLPVSEEKTYTAEEIGARLGISANKVGRIANTNNLKTDQYGKLYHDKSKYSCKEVDTFKYYENVIPVLEKYLKEGKHE